MRRGRRVAGKGLEEEEEEEDGVGRARFRGVFERLRCIAQGEKMGVGCFGVVDRGVDLY